MRRTGIALLAGMFVLSIAAGGCATAPAGKSAGTGEPPSWQTSSVVEETATVMAVEPVDPDGHPEGAGGELGHLQGE